MSIAEPTTTIGININGQSISLSDYAFLNLTNDLSNEEFSKSLKEKPKENEKIKIQLTTKDVYYWGVLLAKLVEATEDISIDELEQRTQEAFVNAINEYQGRIRNYYNSFGLETEIEIFDLATNKISENFGLATSFNHINIQEEVNKTYQDLVERDLIEDPIDLPFGGPFTILLIGLIPYSFSRKTKKGDKTLREIQALLWKVKVKKTKGKYEFNFLFKLDKLLKAFSELPEHFKNILNEKEKKKKDED